MNNQESKKLTIKNLSIYSPSILNRRIDLDETIKCKNTIYYKHENEDIDVDSFLHFPIILNNDGSLWKEGNLYLLDKLKSYTKPSPKTLASIAKDLKDFKNYFDIEKINYLAAPRKLQGPVYVYRGYLQKLLNEQKLSSNVIRRK